MANGQAGFPVHQVCEPDGTRRPPEPRDAMMRVNDDGSVSIPGDVEVFAGVHGDLWFRTPRLKGWNGFHGGAMTVPNDGPPRDLYGEVVAELARQGRGITPGLPPGYRP